MGICKHYGEEFDCCKLLSDFSNPMTDLRPCTKDEYECKYYKPHTNFDRISESAESLAAFIVNNTSNCYHCFLGIDGKCEFALKYLGDEACLKSIKEWLQKERDND